MCHSCGTNTSRLAGSPNVKTADPEPLGSAHADQDRQPHDARDPSENGTSAERYGQPNPLRNALTHGDWR